MGERKLLFFGALVILLLALSACGKYDAPTGEAAAQPEQTEEPAAEPAPAEPAEESATEPTKIDASLEEPTNPPPTPSDEELKEQQAEASGTSATSLSIKITATLNSPKGMTRVVVEGGDKPESYLFPTTNKDAVISRTAQRIGAAPSEIENIITWVGEDTGQHTRNT